MEVCRQRVGAGGGARRREPRGGVAPPPFPPTLPRASSDWLSFRRAQDTFSSSAGARERGPES